MQTLRLPGPSREGNVVVFMLVGAAALLVLLVVLLSRARPPGPVSERKYLVAPVGSVPEARQFTWKRPRGAAKFYVELFEQDGTLLWSQSTADTTLPLPDRLGLSTNRVYRWRVTYTFADGVSLPTNDESFMLAPGPPGRP